MMALLAAASVVGHSALSGIDQWCPLMKNPDDFRAKREYLTRAF
jgi:hypothetical protein